MIYHKKYNEGTESVPEVLMVQEVTTQLKPKKKKKYKVKNFSERINKITDYIIKNIIKIKFFILAAKDLIGEAKRFYKIFYFGCKRVMDGDRRFSFLKLNLCQT